MARTSKHTHCRYCGDTLRKPVFADSWEALGYCNAECCLREALAEKAQDPSVARAVRELLED